MAGALRDQRIGDVAPGRQLTRRGRVDECCLGSPDLSRDRVLDEEVRRILPWPDRDSGRRCRRAACTTLSSIPGTVSFCSRYLQCLPRDMMPDILERQTRSSVSCRWMDILKSRRGCLVVFGRPALHQSQEATKGHVSGSSRPACLASKRRQPPPPLLIRPPKNPLHRPPNDQTSPTHPFGLAPTRKHLHRPPPPPEYPARHPHPAHPSSRPPSSKFFESTLQDNADALHGEEQGKCPGRAVGRGRETLSRDGGVVEEGGSEKGREEGDRARETERVRKLVTAETERGAEPV